MNVGHHNCVVDGDVHARLEEGMADCDRLEGDMVDRIQLEGGMADHNHGVGILAGWGHMLELVEPHRSQLVGEVDRHCHKVGVGQLEGGLD